MKKSLRGVLVAVMAVLLGGCGCKIPLVSSNETDPAEICTQFDKTKPPSCFDRIFKSGTNCGIAKSFAATSLEEQINNVAIAVAFLRINEVVANEMPISADAEWIDSLVSLSDSHKSKIKTMMAKDPYHATIAYTKEKGAFGNIIDKIFGSSCGADFDVYRYIDILYTDKSHPNPYTLPKGLGSLLQFPYGKLRTVQAMKYKRHASLDDALISLTPTSFQKTLKQQRHSLKIAQRQVLKAQNSLGDSENQLTSGTNRIGKKLSAGERKTLEKNIGVQKKRVEQKEQEAQKKQNIYLKQLDQALAAMKKKLDLSEGKTRLACKINKLSNKIDAMLTGADKLFGAAATQVYSRRLIQRAPGEIIEIGKGLVTAPKQKKALFKQRLKRLKDNVIYLLPNISMGLYYAQRQLILNAKYQEIAGYYIKAYNIKYPQKEKV